MDRINGVEKCAMIILFYVSFQLAAGVCSLSHVVFSIKMVIEIIIVDSLLTQTHTLTFTHLSGSNFKYCFALNVRQPRIWRIHTMVKRYQYCIQNAIHCIIIMFDPLCFILKSQNQRSLMKDLRALNILKHIHFDIVSVFYLEITKFSIEIEQFMKQLFGHIVDVTAPLEKLKQNKML